MFCKFCGKQIDDCADICVYCGAKTENYGKNLAKNKFCTHCGYPLGENTAACTHCGASVKTQRKISTTALAILGFVLCLISTMVSAIVAVYGIVKSYIFGDEKGFRLNIAAFIFSIIVSILILILNLF